MEVTPAPDGRTLYIHRMDGGCCSLYAFDLASGHLEHLIDISQRSTITGDGRWLATSRGAPGVEVFDAATNQHAAVIPAGDAVYFRLNGHPHGRWVAGLNNFRESTVAFFDLEQQTLGSVIERPLAGDGAWLGERFYLYGISDDHHQLWSLEPNATDLGQPLDLDLPTATPENLPESVVTAAGEQWITLHYAIIWHSTTGGRPVLGPNVPGGVFVIDPHSGVVRHLIPDVDIAHLAATADGQRVVALDVGASPDATSRLLLVDIESGDVLSERDLDGTGRGYWGAVTTTLPADLLADLRRR